MPNQPASGILAEAERRFQDGQRFKAIELVQEVLNTDATHCTALMMMGHFLFKSAQYESCIQHLLRIEKVETDSQRLSECFYSLSSVLCLVQNFELAAEYALKSLQLKLGIQLLSHRSSSSYPLKQVHDYLLIQVRDCVYNHKLKIALNLCNQILKAEPNHTIAMQLKNFFTSDLTNLWHQAVECHNKGELPAAEAKYRILLSLLPEHHEGLYGLGVLVSQQGKLDQAQHLIEQAIELSPNMAHYHLNLGNILASQNNLEEAIRAWKTALKVTPDFYEAHETLGQWYLKLQNPAEALSHYIFMVQAQPQNPTVHHTLGNIYRETGQLNEALNHYQIALTLNPNYVLAYFNLANLHFIQGQKAQAKACLMQILQLDSTFEPARQILASWQDDSN